MSRSKSPRIVASKSMDWMADYGKQRVGLFLSIRRGAAHITAGDQWYLYTAIASLIADSGAPIPHVLQEAIAEMRSREGDRLTRLTTKEAPEST